jgi:hypothetical protein
MSGKAIRETLGFLAVVASMVFVGFEIRQNTQAIRATAIQESTNAARQQLLMIATDAEVHRISMIAAQDPAQLTAAEAGRYYLMNRSFWWGMQGLYRQWQMGVLPDEEWTVFNRVICGNIAEPGFRVNWSVPETTNELIPSFVAVVESCETFQGG